MSTAKRVRRRSFTDVTIASLPRRAKRYTVADPEQRGLYVRVMIKGAHVFACIARNPAGRQVWCTLGTTSEMKIDEAREAARTAIKRIKAGKPPIEPPKLPPDSVATVCQNYLQRVVIKGKHRTANEKVRIVNKYIIPFFAKERAFVDLRRSDIAALLDHVEDQHGAFQADAVLSVIRGVGSWLVSRDDDYVPPFARGMSRVPVEDRKRKRILDDDELRAVWREAGDAGAFGDLVKMLLLTAQRRGVVVNMAWKDIDLASGVWNIPVISRAKGHGGALKLPKAALEIIRRQPRLVGNDHVFSTRASLEREKAKLNAAAGISKNYTLHDLRRTARSLMSRANVRPDIAERTLGHAQQGVEGVYDRHSYSNEKGNALAKLAKLIDLIVAGPSDGSNVVRMGEAVP